VADDRRPAAADLTEQDLREAAEGRPLPSLDPGRDATRPAPAVRSEPLLWAQILVRLPDPGYGSGAR
jgi:hypothetical protein